MRGMTKIILGAIFLFAVSIYIVSSNAMDLDKNYDASTKIITITNHGTPLIDLQLISNTDQCLEYCEATIKIKPYSDITIQPNDQFVWRFIKPNPNQPDLKSYSFEILQSTPYEVTDYSTTCNPYSETSSNGTILTYENCTQINIGSHTEYKHEYEPFDYYGYNFRVGNEYYIKLKGQKEISDTENNIDWVPTFYGFSIDNWAWWNSSWSNCRNLEIVEKSGKTIYNKPIEFNFTQLVKQTDNDDFRIVNSSCYNGGNEQPYQIIDNTSDSIRAVFQINLTANLSTNWSIYYNNSGATNPGYGSIITYRESFEQAGLNTTYWMQVNNSCAVASGNSGTKNYIGSQSLFITNGGDNCYADVNHVYSNEYSTIQVWHYNNTHVESGNSQQLYVDFQSGAYIGIGSKSAVSVSQYTWRDSSNSPNFQNSNINRAGYNSWGIMQLIANSSGSYLYIQNISVYNYTSGARAITTVHNWVDGGNDLTEYFDEYRYYKNVYDDPSQQYNIILMPEMIFNRITFDTGDYITYDSAGDKFKFFIGDQQVFCINKTGGYGNVC